MKVVNLLLFFLIIVSLIFSGCINEEMLGEESHPVITNIDVMSTPDDDETFDLRVTVYLQNPMDSDTGSLSVRIKTRDSYTNLITGERRLSQSRVPVIQNIILQCTQWRGTACCCRAAGRQQSCGRSCNKGKAH
jgi:hypothetical protein